MKGIFKVELKRAFTKKQNIFIIMLGVFVCLYSVLVRDHSLLFFDYSAKDIDVNAARLEIQKEMNVFPFWFNGMDLYTLIMPLIASLPYSTSLLLDRKINLNNMICLRTKCKKYLISKITANALIGGVVTSVPPLIFLAILYCTLSHQIVEFGVHPTGFMKSLFMTNPLRYILYYSLIAFLFGAVYATLSMAVSIFTNNKIVTTITPFVYWFLGSFILETFKLISISPAMTNAFFVRTNSNLYLILGQLIVFLFLGVTIILKGYRKE